MKIDTLRKVFIDWKYAWILWILIFAVLGSITGLFSIDINIHLGRIE